MYERTGSSKAKMLWLITRNKTSLYRRNKVEMKVHGPELGRLEVKHISTLALNLSRIIEGLYPR